jgi:hypothetical protein
MSLASRGGRSGFKLESSLIIMAVIFNPHNRSPLIRFLRLALQYDDLPFREGIHSIHADARAVHVAGQTKNDLIRRGGVETKHYSNIVGYA